MNRRTFLAGGSAALCATARSTAAPARIIDTHVHFYDPSRPQGVPWPPKDDKLLYRTVLPSEFRRLTKHLGITGVVEVEASPWAADNQWILDLAVKEPIIIGTVGNLDPGKPDFRQQLDQLHRNGRFCGIRVGNLWDRDLPAELAKPEFVAGLRALADAGLEMDTANPNPALLENMLRITDLAPSLRIVLDHLPIDQPAKAAARKSYESVLASLGQRNQVYVKVSSVVRKIDGRVPADAAFYKPQLDQLWDIFGPDRLIYGSNWPVSNRVAPYAVLFQVVREYFAAKGSEASEKYFWRNAAAAYRLKF